MEKSPLGTNSSKDLHLAFDVGHSSIGWAVLQSLPGGEPNLLGCGAVIFPADDCLASQRRQFRRQRRHIRSTRQRIARIKALLAHLGVLTSAQLDRVASSSPWFLAARVLRGGKPLTWPELWDVLRWYAHNRGYDGNKAWSRHEEDAAAAKDDTEKEKMAKGLLTSFAEKYGHPGSMAEVWCDLGGLDPLGEKSATHLSDALKRPKAQNAAFSRAQIVGEVSVILRAHFGKLSHVDETLLAALMSDWRAVPCPEIMLPTRFRGGLLFGQLLPRFDNRIIGRCPMSGEKVPSRRSREFLDFRWTMLMAGVQIARVEEKELRMLNPEERLALDRRARELGFFRYDRGSMDKSTGTQKPGVNELREELIALTGAERDNLDRLLFDGNSREALKVLPVSGDTQAFRLAWGCFDGPSRDEMTGEYRPDALRGRFITKMLRGKLDASVELTIDTILAELDRLGEKAVAERLRTRLIEAATKRGKVDEKKLSELRTKSFGLDRLSGRAPYGRKILCDVVQNWMRRDSPLHPMTKGGAIERTEGILELERERRLDDLTNNHLVRHRLKLLVGDPDAKPKPLRGLFDDLVSTYAGNDPLRIGRVTVEVARDLQEMSGKDSTEKQAIHNQKLDRHERAATALAAAMRASGMPFTEADGRPRFTAALIRKARVALDLEQREESKRKNMLAFSCPYTGRIHCLTDLVRGRLELDHIIPRSQRLSDALEAMVLTAPEINREKKNRTALEFVREMNLLGNRAKRDALCIVTEQQFLAYVDSLWPKSDPFRRARATGERPTDDEIRCWRRKELLRLPKWDKDEFTPGALTKTRHLNKLAVQRLGARYDDKQRPSIVVVPGAVTHAFRDKAWRLLPLLMDRADKENLTPINQVFAEWKASLEKGEGFNLKKKLRETTHLHHALDAAAIGIVAELLVPGFGGSLDGRLVDLIIKRKLSDNERIEFETLADRLRLPRFYRWGKDNELRIEDISSSLKNEIHAALAQRRVVRHIPLETSGLPTMQTVWRVLDSTDTHPNAHRISRWLRNHGVFIPDSEAERAILTRRKRRGSADEEGGGKVFHQTETWDWVYTAEAKSKVLGAEAPAGSKLAAIKGGKIIANNYGLALDPEPQIIPFHKVWVRLRELREKNDGRPVRVLRNGMLIEVQKGIYAGIWRIFSLKNNTTGLALNIGRPDVVRLQDKTEGHKINVLLASLRRDGLVPLNPGLEGVASPPPHSQ